MTQQQELLPCPCCGRRTLSRRGAGDECRRCRWRDDPAQNEQNADQVLEGRNHGLSLNAARKVHQRYGSVRPADYIPNHVPLSRRVFSGLIAALVIAYCGFSLWLGTMILPGGSGNRRPVQLEGMEVWLMSAALLSGVMYGVLAIVDHYDQRRNEHVYHLAVKASLVLMGLFMGLAMVAAAYRSGGGWLALAVGFMALLILFGIITNVMAQKIRY
jgi:hypothetical protein